MNILLNAKVTALFGEVSGRPDAIEYVRAYRDAMVADGWSIEPTYGETESVERAARLRKDGFQAQILTRDDGEDGKYRYKASISIWGPDDLAIKAPVEYSFEAIWAEVSTCQYCRKPGPTERVGFAGRSCASCLPAQRKSQEYPGWTN